MARWTVSAHVRVGFIDDSHENWGNVRSIHKIIAGEVEAQDEAEVRTLMDEAINQEWPVRWDSEVSDVDIRRIEERRVFA